LCRQITSGSTLRDTEWATQSCTISFETIGIWPEGADGTDVNTATKSKDKHLIATGDDFGKVKLYSYPASKQKVIKKLIEIDFRKLIEIPFYQFLVSLSCLWGTFKSRDFSRISS
jgi:hypothetical protein